LLTFKPLRKAGEGKSGLVLAPETRRASITS
jgi:hypothetical protein